MTTITELLTNHAPIVVAALLHSLWISATIGLLVRGVLRRLPVRRNDARYLITLAGLLLSVTGTFVAWSSLELSRQDAQMFSAHDSVKMAYTEFSTNQKEADTATQNHEVQSGKNEIAITDAALLQNGSDLHHDATLLHDPAAPESHSASTEALLPASGASQEIVKVATYREATTTMWNRVSRWLLIGWLVGACVMLLRTVAALWEIKGLRAGLPDRDANGLIELQALTGRLCERIGLQRIVQLILSEKIASPAVVGLVKPVILIPPAMLTGIPPEHWELIIAHELAHVRRFDAIVNLMQMLIESALFFNPAVWWISRQVRIEREACCDAMAANVTGQSIEFARMLLNVASGDWRESAAKPSIKSDNIAANSRTPAIAMSLTNETEAGSVRDRVTRLADPDRRSAPRFTRLGLAVAVAALIGTAVAIQQGTDFAVQAVADLMTPVERVETLARLQAEQSGVFVPPGKVSADSKATDQQQVSDSGRSAKTFSVQVIVRTEDGNPVPKRLHLNSSYQVHTPSGSSHSSSGSFGGGVKEGELIYETSLKLPQCQFIIGGSAPGYAPFETEVRTMFDEADATPIEVTLTRGFASSIALKSEDGQPIPGAQLSGGGIIKLQGSSCGSNTLNETTSPDGTAKLEHCGIVAYSLSVRAEGYQYENFEVHLKPDDATVLILKKARPTVLRVVDNVTGQPIAGAICVEQHRRSGAPGNTSSAQYGDPRNHTRRDWRSLGESDVDGIINVNQLQDGATYTVGIMADGYGTYGINDLQAGTPERLIRLQEPISVSGRITGDMTRLEKNRKSPKKRTLRYRNPLGGSGERGNFLAAAVEADGHFVVHDVVSGFINFALPGNGPNSNSFERFAVEKSRNDITLHITEPAVERASTAETGPMRDVIIRLSGVSETAPARGFLRVSWHGTAVGTFQPGKNVPFVDNQIKLTVPVGLPLLYEAHGMVGYFVNHKSQSVTIEAGSEPQLVDVPVEPAGAVYGRLIGDDGQPVGAGHIRVYPADVSWLSKWKGNSRSLNPSGSSGSSNFFRSLPFGGTYIISGRTNGRDGVQWGVSKPFTINGAHPVHEMDLQLKPGKSVSVRLLGQNGKPIGQVDVGLNISLKCDAVDGSSSFSVTSTTGADGGAVFINARPGDPTNTMTVSASVSVADVPGYIGRRVELDELTVLDGIYQLQLRPAVSARGILVDANSGRPVPGANIRIHPRDFQAATFKGTIKTTTDTTGQFVFDSLEEIEYYGHIDGAAVKGTKITMLPTGAYQMKPPTSGPINLYLTGGSSEPVRWEVELVPGYHQTPIP